MSPFLSTSNNINKEKSRSEYAKNIRTSVINQLLIQKAYHAFAAMLYNLSDAHFPLKIISEDTDKLKPTTINDIWKSYTEDKIGPRIIQAKQNGLCKISYNITKNSFKLELRDYQVFYNLFHIKTYIYISSNNDNMLYTSIIKKVHISLPT